MSEVQWPPWRSISTAPRDGRAVMVM